MRHWSSSNPPSRLAFKESLGFNTDRPKFFVVLAGLADLGLETDGTLQVDLGSHAIAETDVAHCEEAKVIKGVMPACFREAFLEFDHGLAVLSRAVKRDTERVVMIADLRSQSHRLPGV